MLRATLNNLTYTTKFIHDTIHGNIGLSFIANCVINTIIFQRLSGLKQLGPCRYIYPTAVHTRYEHSLGTYHLAGELISTIANLHNQQEIDSYLTQIPELQDYYNRTGITENLLTPYVRELVKIAGLCHDIGHASFSHLFDDVFLPKVDFSNNPNKSHEHRSNLLINKIIKEHPILSEYMTDSDLSFIKELINPSKNKSGFIFEIVSNDFNGIDVDKLDYLQRDIKTVDFCAKIDTTMLTKHIKIANNHIVYPIHAFEDIENLFRTRYKMYKHVYLHPNVTSVEYLITEIMIELNKIMNLASSINNMNDFITLTDSTIIECTNIIEKLHIDLTEEQLISYNKIKELKHRLETRDFYQLLFSITTKQKINPSLILEKLNLSDFVIFSIHKIGFLSGNKPNPFETIYFFDNNDFPMTIGTAMTRGFDLPVLESTKTHQEFVTNFYFSGSSNSFIIPDIKRTLQLEFSI